MWRRNDDDAWIPDFPGSRLIAVYCVVACMNRKCVLFLGWFSLRRWEIIAGRPELRICCEIC